MAIKINNNSYSKFYLDGDEVSKIYLNSSLVYTASSSGGDEPVWDEWEEDFLTFTALEATDIGLSVTAMSVPPTVYYKKQGDSAYTQLTTGNIISLNRGEQVKFYGNNAYWSQDNNRYAQFTSTGKFNISGKLTSVLSSGCPETLSTTYCFRRTFAGTDVVDASGLILPTGHSSYCFRGTLQVCPYLEKLPKNMPNATAQGAYSYFCNQCTSLTHAIMPSGVYDQGEGYEGMFQDCSGLTGVTILAEDITAQSSINYLFQRCTAMCELKCASADWSVYSEKNNYEGWFNGATDTVGTAYLDTTNALDIASWKSNANLPPGWDAQAMSFTTSAATVSTDTPAYIVGGETFSLNARLNVETDTTEFTYSSSDDSVITVDSNGVVSGISKGSETITVNASNCKDYKDAVVYTGSTQVNVDVYHGNNITISYTAPDTLQSGQTHNLNASTTPTGYTLEYSSSNPSAVTVDGNGVITALVDKGKADITISTENVVDNVNKEVYTAEPVTINVKVGSVWEEWEKDLLTFTALEATDITLSPNQTGATYPTVYYKKDSDSEYTQMTSLTTISLNSDEEVKFYGSNTRINKTTSRYVRFTSTGRFEASGKVTSLLSSGGTDPTTASTYNYVFACLFRDCTKLVSAKNLVLPGVIPQRGCAYMFDGCTNLETAPALPAMTLSNNCYSRMFNGCTSMVTAPELPASAATSACYEYMFVGCTNLVNVPVINIVSAANYTYSYMFSDCSKLASVSIKTTAVTNTNAFSNWLRSTASSGTVYAPANRTYTDSNMNLPSGWSVQDLPT